MNNEQLTMDNARTEGQAATAAHVPPGYKQTEVGVIPVEWEVKTLADLCHAIVDGTHYTPKYLEDGVPFYSVENVTADNFTDVKFISQAEHERLTKRCKPERGDILLTRIGSLGATKLLNWEVNASIYVSLALLKPNSGTEPRYLYCYSQSKQFVQDVENRSLLNASPKKINMEAIGSIPIPLPPPPEQRAIAAALADVDGLITALDRLIAKKRAIKQATMQQLLTGKTRLPGFGGAWETKRLGEVAVIRNQKVMPSSVDPDTLCIELEHISHNDGRLGGSSTARDSRSSKYLFVKGDVLFGRLRSYLRKFWLAETNGLCSTEIWPLMIDTQQIVAGFLYGIVQTDQFIEIASVSYGTHMPRADWAVIRNFEIKLPPLPEQAAIAAVLSDMDAEIAALAQRRDKTQAIKQGMMQQMLTGRVRLMDNG